MVKFSCFFTLNVF